MTVSQYDHVVPYTDLGGRGYFGVNAALVVIDDWCISCEIAIRWMLLDLTDDKSTLVQVMDWCRQATSHYLCQCWPRSMWPYGFIRPQWVNDMITYPCPKISVNKRRPCYPWLLIEHKLVTSILIEECPCRGFSSDFEKVSTEYLDNFCLDQDCFLGHQGYLFSEVCM